MKPEVLHGLLSQHSPSSEGDGCGEALATPLPALRAASAGDGDDNGGGERLAPQLHCAAACGVASRERREGRGFGRT